MAFNIEEMRHALALGGARPTLFQVVITPPSGGLGLSSVAVAKIPFLCVAASLPESQLGVIQVPYFGRKMKLPGDRTFDPWPVTIVNDEDFLIRNFLEQWHAQINELQGNMTQFTTASPLLQEGSAIVTQLSKTGIPIRSYSFVGIWPQLVSAIPVDWNATDQIESFQCTFMYDYFQIAGITGIITG